MSARNGKIYFFLITFLVGFMIAIQFKTVKEPNVRDTKDTWQLRESINNEMDLQSSLLKEVRRHDKKIHDYETEMRDDKEAVLQQTIAELKKEAGFTEVTGTGITLTIKPVDYFLIVGENPTISPMVLQRLINEVNMYGAKQISIDGERYINTSVIRDINGETKVGTHTINRFPVRVQIIVENMEIAKKMYNRLQISPVLDDFFVDNLQLDISPPQTSITVPAYVDPVHVRNMEPVEDKGGG